ncbi:glycoside hydrolase family 73 protein [Lactovum odontotermitis]
MILTVGFCLLNAVTASDSQSEKSLNQQYESFKRAYFIQEIAPLAQTEHQKYGILSSLTLAQACLESDFGQSLLSAKYYNLFGVKAYGNAPKISLDTKEYENGKLITIKGDFRVYQSWQESVEAHSQLFVNGVDWDPDKYQSVLAAPDYLKAALAVQAAGYATDLNYADKLIKLIEEYKLYDYDL